jgi:hypothetical protein
MNTLVNLTIYPLTAEALAALNRADATAMQMSRVGQVPPEHITLPPQVYADVDHVVRCCRVTG